MKSLILVFMLSIYTFSQADDLNTSLSASPSKHDLYLTVYLLSAHWTKNDSTGEEFNDTHKAYGLEYIYQDKYSLSYNNFINSRGKEVDVIGAGYLYDLYDDTFGLHIIGGYQEGYCFDGFLSSVECTEGKDNTGAFVLPLLYYKNRYFKVDFFTNSDMVAFRFNIKITDLF